MLLEYNPIIKRLMDIVLAWAAIIILSPIFILFSILICIDSKGSPFFKQKRIGKDMVPFLLVKFRSMSPRKNANKGSFDLGSSSRVTRIGRFLRDKKIDELPQLFNVLKGEMSIVGPRPEIPRYVEDFTNEFKDVLGIRPGLSDFASITYRDEESILAAQNEPETYYRNVILPDKLRLSKTYTQNVSLKNDLIIIIRTLNRIRSKS